MFWSWGPSYEWKGASRPVLAMTPGRVALHEPGAAATRILDTSTGRELALLPPFGGTVEGLGWLSAGLCAVSIHEGGEAACVAVEWVDGNGKVRWSRPPPVASVRALPCASGEIRNYRHAPRYRKLPGYWNLETAGAVWIFTGASLQGIDIKSGKLLFDAPLGSVNPLTQPSFFFDEGSFAYGHCLGPAPGGLVFTACGRELVVFNGLTALVVNLPQGGRRRAASSPRAISAPVGEPRR